MHKKYFNFVLPIFGAIVVVGSGFSAWVFSDTITKTNDISGEITLAPSATLNASLASNVTSFKVHLDQGGLNNDVVTEGISFTDFGDAASATGNKLTVTLTYTLTSDIELNDDWQTIQDASEFAVTVTLPTGLDTHLEAAVTTTGKFDFTDSESAADNKTKRVGTATFELAVSYKTKPTTKTAYDALNSAITAAASETIDVGITATTFKPATNA